VGYSELGHIVRPCCEAAARTGEANVRKTALLFDVLERGIAVGLNAA
jgi:hypothetical protein